MSLLSLHQRTPGSKYSKKKGLWIGGEILVLSLPLVLRVWKSCDVESISKLWCLSRRFFFSWDDEQKSLIGEIIHWTSVLYFTTTGLRDLFYDIGNYPSTSISFKTQELKRTNPTSKVMWFDLPLFSPLQHQVYGDKNSSELSNTTYKVINDI